MSSFAVTIEELEIFDHPDADALELAQVGGYHAVVPKGAYVTGDCALYIPEAAVLPPDLIEEIGLVGKLAGPDKNRVKAVRLRGALSQGIVTECKALYEAVNNEPLADHLGEDFAEALGITKWVPPVPTQLDGQVVPAPNLAHWPDIENIKRFPQIFTVGEQVVATEKIHGTCMIATYVDEGTEPELLVSSKGFGSKHLALVESDTNLYWKMAHNYQLKERLAAIAAEFDSTYVAVFGEVFGHNVQDLHYAKEGQFYRAFDLWVAPATLPGRFIDTTEAFAILEAHGIPTVPVLYEGNYDADLLEALTDGTESVSGDNLHLSEGIVVRPATEGRSHVTGSRKIAKFVSEAYLTRKGDTTEYE